MDTSDMTARKAMTPTVRTVTYRGAPGSSEELRLDVHRAAPAPEAPRSGQEVPGPAVLLWHGVGPKERGILAPLAEAVAALGVTVLVPDWRPDSADGGSSDLLASWNWVMDHAAEFEVDPGRVVVAGWSAGAGAALGLALRPGAAPASVVGLAGNYRRPARTTGRSPLDDCGDGREPAAPVFLVHGTADTQVDVQESREMARALRSRGVTATLLELPVDHAGIIGTVHDPAVGRCVPARESAAVAAGARTARLLATTALAAASALAAPGRAPERAHSSAPDSTAPDASGCSEPGSENGC